MIDKNKINGALWLNESQKGRLRAVYEATKFKDIDMQAFDMLKFDEPGANKVSPCEYKNMIVNLMLLFPKSGLGNLEEQAYKGMLWNLYLFFDILDCNEFHAMCDIEEAYNYGDDNGSHEDSIEKLYREHLNETKEKLNILQNI